MTTVAERDERVRAYLEELERALRVLPAPQAAELMEQITAHLDEALPPGSAGETVAIVLRRLGSPEKLAAEARTNDSLGEPATDAAAPETGHSKPPSRPLRYRFSRRGWSALAAGLAVVCVLSAWVGLYLTTPSLSPGGSSTWWSPQDQAQSVDSSTLGASASTVQARRGQWQGFVVEIQNQSNSAQTVLGLATSMENPTGLVGMANVTHVEVGVSTYANYDGGSEYTNNAGALIGIQGMHYTTGQTLQPGQFRFLRVMWLTDSCSLANGAGLTGTEQVNLDVQVGWFSREEDLSLLPGFQLLFGDGCPT